MNFGIRSLSNDLVEFESLVKKKQSYKLKYISNKNETCFVTFQRKKRLKPASWVGPAAGLGLLIGCVKKSKFVDY
jgi:hypothetical protein